MAKIIVDINEDNKYHFIVKKDTNRPLAYSPNFDTKNECMDFLNHFKRAAHDFFGWNFKVDQDGYHYAEFIIYHLSGWLWTKKYNSKSDLTGRIILMQKEININTPVFHTVVRNSKFHNNA